MPKLNSFERISETLHEQQAQETIIGQLDSIHMPSSHNVSGTNIIFFQDYEQQLLSEDEETKGHWKNICLGLTRSKRKLYALANKRIPKSIYAWIFNLMDILQMTHGSEILIFKEVLSKPIGNNGIPRIIVAKKQITQIIITLVITTEIIENLSVIAFRATDPEMKNWKWQQQSWILDSFWQINALMPHISLRGQLDFSKKSIPNQIADIDMPSVGAIQEGKEQNKIKMRKNKF
ncbi:hypothetical protein ACJX0J_012912 [Zea mays]